MLSQQIFEPEPQAPVDLGQSIQDGLSFPQSLTERYQPTTIGDFIGLERPKKPLNARD